MAVCLTLLRPVMEANWPNRSRFTDGLGRKLTLGFGHPFTNRRNLRKSQFFTTFHKYLRPPGEHTHNYPQSVFITFTTINSNQVEIAQYGSIKEKYFLYLEIFATKTAHPCQHNLVYCLFEGFLFQSQCFQAKIGTTL